MNEYEKIISAIEEWSEKHYYSDMVVRINLDGLVTNELLLLSADTGNYTRYYWLNDWYEGQTKVELVGFIPIDMISIFLTGG